MVFLHQDPLSQINSDPIWSRLDKTVFICISIVAKRQLLPFHLVSVSTVPFCTQHRYGTGTGKPQRTPYGIVQCVLASLTQRPIVCLLSAVRLPAVSCPSACISCLSACCLLSICLRWPPVCVFDQCPLALLLPPLPQVQKSQSPLWLSLNRLLYSNRVFTLASLVCLSLLICHYVCMSAIAVFTFQQP